MRTNVPKQLELRTVYAVLVAVLVALALLIWFVATPLGHYGFR